MIKIFTLNSNSKIELTKEELEQIIQEAQLEMAQQTVFNNLQKQDPIPWWVNNPQKVTCDSSNSITKGEN
jgi:lysozyme family protein